MNKEIEKKERTEQKDKEITLSLKTYRWRMIFIALAMFGLGRIITLYEFGILR